MRIRSTIIDDDAMCIRKDIGPASLEPVLYHVSATVMKPVGYNACCTQTTGHPLIILAATPNVASHAKVGPRLDTPLLGHQHLEPANQREMNVPQGDIFA